MNMTSTSDDTLRTANEAGSAPAGAMPAETRDISALRQTDECVHTDPRAGKSVAKIIEQRREQFHQARVGENLSPLNTQVQSYFSRGGPYFMQQTGDPARSQQMTLQTLDNLRQQQAVSLAYFDVFWLFAVLSLGLVLLVFLMKRSVAEKGEIFGGE